MSDKLLKEILFSGIEDMELEGVNLKNMGIGLDFFDINEEDLEDDEEDKKIKKKEISAKEASFKEKDGVIRPKPRVKLAPKQIESSIENQKQNFPVQASYQEKDLGLDVICVSDREKIYKLSDLFIPKDDNIIRKIEKYNMKIMSESERVKPEKDMDMKKENEVDDLKQMLKKAKRNQKFTKIGFTYNEKFFDRTFFIENFNKIPFERKESGEEIKKDEQKKEHIVLNPKIIENTLMNSVYEFKKNLKSLNNEIIYIPGEEIHYSDIDMDDAFTTKYDSNTGEENDLKIINSIVKDNDAFIYKEFEGESENMKEMYDNFSFTDNNNEQIEYVIEKESNPEANICLYDRYKKKIFQQEGYFNKNLIESNIKDYLIIDCNKVNPNFLDLAHKVYDLNDYNMTFEVQHDGPSTSATTVIPPTSLTTRKESIGNMMMLPNQSNLSPEEFFNNFTNKLNSASNVANLNPLIGKSKSNILTHAKCAYNLTYNKINMTYDDLKDFHRPDFSKFLLKEKKKKNFSFTISDKFNISSNENFKRWNVSILTKNYLKKKEKKRINKNIQYMNAYEIFKDRYKLSLIDGKYVLTEHIDEYPLFINNFGMASKLKKFIYSSKLFHSNLNNPNNKLTDSEVKTINLMGPYGSQILLQPTQKLPLIGQIDTNEVKGLSIIDNKMYRAPVFYEKIGNKPDEPSIKNASLTNSATNFNTNNTNNKSVGHSGKRMNFLIIFKKSKEGKESFYIRELEHHYVIGQEEPKIEVYPPQSRQYNNFLKKKIQTYTYKLYDEIGFKSGINFKVFSNLFPNVTEQILKKIFREMRIDIDKNICYFTKIPSDENQILISPENVCQYESCQFGIFKLREVGIKNLTNPDKISYACNKFIQQTTDVKHQYLAKVIEEELLTTPWNITQHFLQAKQIKGMLSIKGIGDPSNGMGGYSFLKMPVKSYNDNKTLKEELDALKNMNKNITTVTGTDADLRKLNKEDIKMKLIQLGVEEDYINKLSRWDRVSLLRYKSSQAAQRGYSGEITKYARNNRMSSNLQREAYQKNINEVFKRQIEYIIDPLTHYEHDNDIRDENEDFVNALIKAETQKKLEESIDTNLQNQIPNENQVLYPKKRKEKRLGFVSDHQKRTNEKIIKVYKKSNKNNGQLEDANTKIILPVKPVDLEFLKRKKKHSQSFDNVFEYELDKTNSFYARKRKEGPSKLFNELIEEIIDKAINFDSTKLFHQPVKKKEYPDYYAIIQNPMDMATMKTKTKRCEYQSLNDLNQDVEQIVNNSVLYNGEEHEVTRQARLLCEFFDRKIEE